MFNYQQFPQLDFSWGGAAQWWAWQFCCGCCEQGGGCGCGGCEQGGGCGGYPAENHQYSNPSID